MAIAANKPCRKCRKPTRNASGFCDRHEKKEVTRKKDAAKIYDRARGSAAARGYGRQWQKARHNFLVHNPLCKSCLDIGKVTAATVVDHIKPHKGDKRLFWNKSNWQALCKRCHDVKTATEDGAFGK